MKAVVLLVVAVVAAVAVLPNVALADCSQTVDACQETFFLNGQAYSFDLNALCNETEYIAQDSAQHIWRFNICSSTISNCYPATWDEVYDNGAAIQYWGATPPCTVPGCRDYDTDQPICCTANCEVVAHGDPALTLIDPNNPATGGVMLSYRRMVPDPSDPNFCETDPVTGRPYGRQVRYVIACNQNADNLIVTSIVTNSTNDCSYTIYMQSSAACACVPDCSNSECGWDGCTSVCGDCDLGTVCMPDGTCCQPNCLNANCGADGCGGSCGACPEDYICNTQTSICVLNEQVATPSNGGAVAGAFFGGMAAAGFLGFVVYWLRFRNRGTKTEAAASFGSSGNKYGSL